MIKKTIEVSRQPAHISGQMGQLVLQPPDTGKDAARRIPAEDIGAVLLDHPQITLTLGSLQTLMQHGATVVVSGRNHLPAGVMLPISGNTEQVKRFRHQVAAKQPLVKRLWQQVVQAKIRGQAANVPLTHPRRRRLNQMVQEVKSGDTSNCEAHAAQAAWGVWAERWEGFRRDPDGPDLINGFLNYGYAVHRAAVARAIVLAGLHPALGIHHRHRANAFCLADDLMEPFRPVVDRCTWQLLEQGATELDQPTKAQLLSTLTAPCETNGERGPLMVHLHRYVASLVQSFETGNAQLAIPWALSLNNDPEALPCNSVGTEACG